MTSSPSGTSSWIGDAPPLIAQAGLLPAVTGERLLDIACGQGRMSRFLARLGADVVGVDISAAMLGKARAAGPKSIAYIRADITWRPVWWDGRLFDGCTCELALMDIDDLAGTLSTVTTVLRPGGLVHRLDRASMLSWQRPGPQQLAGGPTSPDHLPSRWRGARTSPGPACRRRSHEPAAVPGRRK